MHFGCGTGSHRTAPIEPGKKKKKKLQKAHEIHTSVPLMPPTTKTNITFWSARLGFACKIQKSSSAYYGKNHLLIYGSATCLSETKSSEATFKKSPHSRGMVLQPRYFMFAQDTS